MTDIFKMEQSGKRLLEEFVRHAAELQDSINCAYSALCQPPELGVLCADDRRVDLAKKYLDKKRNR